MKYNFDEIIVRERTNSLKYDMREKIFGKADVIPLWVADMDFRTPDFIVNALKKRLEHEILGYTITPSSFNTSIAEWCSRHYNWHINTNWISFSPGVVPAINLLIMEFTDPGDGVIIQPPVYFPFFSAVKNHRRRLVLNPLCFENGKYSMDLNDLESKIDDKTRMLILCSPHNPTGNIWPPEVLRSLAQICIKHNMLMISDEIHADLLYPGHNHTPLASLSGETAAVTITCMSPSKTFNLAGLSTAFLVIPNDELRKRYERILDHVHVGAGNIFGFEAAEAAYTFGDEWLNQLMHYLQGNLAFLFEYINRHIPRIKIVHPQATYLVWIDCRDLALTDNELHAFMIEKAGVGLNAGVQFGIAGSGFLRINIGCPRRILHEALDKIKAAIDKKYEK